MDASRLQADAASREQARDSDPATAASNAQQEAGSIMQDGSAEVGERPDSSMRAAGDAEMADAKGSSDARDASKAASRPPAAQPDEPEEGAADAEAGEIADDEPGAVRESSPQPSSSVYMSDVRPSQQANRRPDTTSRGLPLAARLSGKVDPVAAAQAEPLSSRQDFVDDGHEEGEAIDSSPVRRPPPERLLSQHALSSSSSRTVTARADAPPAPAEDSSEEEGMVVEEGQIPEPHERRASSSSRHDTSRDHEHARRRSPELDSYGRARSRSAYAQPPGPGLGRGGRRPPPPPLHAPEMGERGRDVEADREWERERERRRRADTSRSLSHPSTPKDTDSPGSAPGLSSGWPPQQALLSSSSGRERGKSGESASSAREPPYRRDSRDRERYRDGADRERDRDRPREHDRERDRDRPPGPPRPGREGSATVAAAYADARRFGDRSWDAHEDRRAPPPPPLPLLPANRERDAMDPARADRVAVPPTGRFPVKTERDRWGRPPVAMREWGRDPSSGRARPPDAPAAPALSGQEAIRNAYSRRRLSPELSMRPDGADDGAGARGLDRERFEEARRGHSPTRSVTGSDRGYERPSMLQSHYAREREEANRAPLPPGSSKVFAHVRDSSMQRTTSGDSDERRTESSPTPRETPMETPVDPGFVARRDALVEKALRSSPPAPTSSPPTADAIKPEPEDSVASPPPRAEVKVEASAVEETREDREAFKAEARRQSIPTLSAANLAPPAAAVVASEAAVTASLLGTADPLASEVPEMRVSAVASPLDALADAAAASEAPKPAELPVAPTAPASVAVQEPVPGPFASEVRAAAEVPSSDMETLAVPTSEPLAGETEADAGEAADVPMSEPQPAPEEDEDQAESEPELSEEARQKLEEEREAAVRRATCRIIAGQSDMEDPTRAIIKANRSTAKLSHVQMAERSLFPEVYFEQGPLWLQLDSDPVKLAQKHIRRVELARQRRLHDKVERLRRQYRKLNDEWRTHCEHLDRWNERKERRSAAHTGTGTPAPEADFAGSSMMTPMTGRANRRNMNTGFAGFGDAVRSEAEFLEILASLESADMQDPTMRAARTTATCPDMLLNADSSKPLFNDYEDNNGYVADPLAFYLDKFDPDRWSDEEKTTYLRKYALYPKQFGKIASFLEHKTTQQCVAFYYATKKLPNYDYKGLAAARNRERKRKVRPKKKAKGSALMADLTATKGDDADGTDEVDSPAEPPAASLTNKRKPSMTSSRMASQPDQDDARAPSSLGKKRRPTESQAAEAAAKKKSKKARKSKDLSASKADLAQELQLSITPADGDSAATRALNDLAAAEALEALAGVATAEVPGDKTKKSRKSKTPVGPEGEKEVKKKPRSSTSSYWSVAERTEFLKALATHGEDWEVIAATLPTKSAAQAKNYFNRMTEKESEESKDFLEAAQLAAQNAGLPLEQRQQEAVKMVMRQGAAATGPAPATAPPTTMPAGPRMGSFATSQREEPARVAPVSAPAPTSTAISASQSAPVAPPSAPPMRSFGISSLLNEQPPKPAPISAAAREALRNVSHDLQRQLSRESNGGEDTDEEESDRRARQQPSNLPPAGQFFDHPRQEPQASRYQSSYAQSQPPAPRPFLPQLTRAYQTPYSAPYGAARPYAPPAVVSTPLPAPYEQHASADSMQTRHGSLERPSAHERSAATSPGLHVDHTGFARSGTAPPPGRMPSPTTHLHPALSSMSSSAPYSRPAPAPGSLASSYGTYPAPGASYRAQTGPLPPLSSFSRPLGYVARAEESRSIMRLPPPPGPPSLEQLGRPSSGHMHHSSRSPQPPDYRYDGSHSMSPPPSRPYPEAGDR